MRGTAEIMAHAEANVYHVHFDGNGGPAIEGKMEDQDMVYDQPQNLFANQFTRPGGSFMVWTENKDGSGKTYDDQAAVKNLTTENDSTVTLYAQWYMTTFDLDYDLNGGKLSSGKTNPDRYWADSPTFTLNNPVKTDYTFTRITAFPRR